MQTRHATEEAANVCQNPDSQPGPSSGFPGHGATGGLTDGFSWRNPATMAIDADKALVLVDS
jgi:hypothetical protein